MKLAVLDANAFWTEELFRQCARFSEVLLLKPREFRAHWKLSGTIRSDAPSRVVGDRVWEKRLPMPPGWMVEFWPWSQRRIARALRAFAEKEPLVLVVTYPQYRGLVSSQNCAFSVYYNLDDYRDHWPRHRACVPTWEAETVKAADVTICIAAHRVKLLAEQHPMRRDRLHHLPLGCTPEFMASERHSVPRFLPALHSLPRPLAGYIGALNFRFDFALIAEVAIQLPDVTFVLGGRLRDDGNSSWRTGLRRARAMPNIHFLGWVDHSQLGVYLNSFDVLLMPYAHCRFNTNACPAKLWDYLGTGKPIVANDANPETVLWRDVVQVAATPLTFAQAVRDSLTEQDSQLQRRRLEIAHSHTWEQLSRRLQQILEPYLAMY